MPHVPYVPAANRFFARIEKFACECPSCGELIVSHYDTRDTPLRLATMAKRRGAAATRPEDSSILNLVWNPHTQRVKCPHCQKVLILGLLAYDPPRTHIGQPRSYEPPADTVPTRRQHLELRQAGGGWWAEQRHVAGGEVNLLVDNPCCCPRKGWVASCPVHGDPAEVATLLKGVEK